MTMMKKLLTSAVASALMASGAQAAISDNTVKIGYLADMSGTYRDLAGPNGLTALVLSRVRPPNSHPAPTVWHSVRWR